jgi:hypothetical protein
LFGSNNTNNQSGILFNKPGQQVQTGGNIFGNNAPKTDNQQGGSPGNTTGVGNVPNFGVNQPNNSATTGGIFGGGNNNSTTNQKPN